MAAVPGDFMLVPSDGPEGRIMLRIPADVWDQFHEDDRPVLIALARTHALAEET